MVRARGDRPPIANRSAGEPDFLTARHDNNPSTKVITMNYLTEDQIANYHRDGYIIVDDIMTPEEVQILTREINIDDPKAGRGITDGSGRGARLAFWSDLESTIWGAASKCPRVMNSIRLLAGEEVGFFHGKVTLKEAHTGGAWEWHQDFGYWYDQGYVFPRMISVAIALDENTLDNGCMQLLKGSHKLGRISHVRINQQTGADPVRFAQIEPFFEKVPALMKPGAALFFHSNTLHASSANNSPRHRRNFICCYNALGNPQIGEHQTSQRFPVPVGPDDVILQFAKAHPHPSALKDRVVPTDAPVK